MRVYLVPRINPISSAKERQLTVLKLRDETESINIITTNSGASTSHPKLGAGSESRGVRMYLVPRVNPISSAKERQLAVLKLRDQTETMNNITTSGASTSLRKLGSDFMSSVVRTYLVQRINPVSSTETAACCSQVAGPNRKHGHHHHKQRRINITFKAGGWL